MAIRERAAPGGLGLDWITWILGLVGLVLAVVALINGPADPLVAWGLLAVSAAAVLGHWPFGVG